MKASFQMIMSIIYRAVDSFERIKKNFTALLETFPNLKSNKIFFFLNIIPQ